MALQKSDWVDAGYLIMSTKGVEAVKIVVLARHLNTSKGSFYWHFKNRQELLEAILQRWENVTMWFIEESKKATNPKDKLIKLISLSEDIRENPYPEAAVAMWSNHDTKVRERLRIIEIKRVNYIKQLLQEHGFDETEARYKAEIMYLAIMSFFQRIKRDDKYDLTMKEFNDFLIKLILSPLTNNSVVKE